MSDQHDESQRDSRDDDAMRALLKRSMTTSEPAPKEPSLLRGVQGRIRRRSRGKFYADGWSTSQSRIGYTLVAVAMLLVLAVAYFALGPTGLTAH